MALFFRWGIAYRSLLEERGLSIPDVQRLCKDHISPPRHYRFHAGDREPSPRELSCLQQRLHFVAKPEIFFREDKNGRPLKNFQLSLPGIKELKR